MAAETTVVFNDVHLYGAALMSVLRKGQTIGAETAKHAAVAAILDPNKTGRVYTSGPQPLPHQASAPGEAPANWTGTLAGSIHIVDEGGDTVSVVVDAPYADALEYGTTTMEPRPFLEPAAREGAAVRDEYYATVAEKLRGAGRVRNVL